MKRPGVTLLFCFLFITLCGQTALRLDELLGRISRVDTVGVQSELLSILSREKDPGVRQLARLALSEFYIAVNMENRADSLLQLCMEEDREILVDSLHAYYNYVQGNYYYKTGNYIVALRLLNNAALIFGPVARNHIHAKCYLARGNIMNTLAYHTDARKSMRVALVYYHHVGDAALEARALNNIALTWQMKGDSANASQYLLRSLAIRDSIGDVMGAGQSLNNLGALMFRFGHYLAALVYYTKGYENRLRANTPVPGLIESRINIGKTIHRLGNSKAAADTLENAKRDAENGRYLELIRRAVEELMTIYAELGQYDNAYREQKLYHEINDSLYNASLKEQVIRTTVRFEYDYKQKQDSIRRAEQEIARVRINEEKEKRNNLIIIALVIGLLLAGVFLYQLYRGYQAKKKSNEIISMQRDILENKQREITESIEYAQYIQQALLPDEAALGQMPAEHFVLYFPKAIVSGDFYWFSPTKDGFLLAVADCTGHGVPGAFMSLLGKENLDKAASQTHSPGEILALLNRNVRKSLHGNVQDGMDIALIRFLKNGAAAQLTFAGANRPLWIYRKGQEMLQELRPTKAAIAGFTAADQIFEETTVTVKAGETIYLFTDGFADQFGGDKIKKITTKKFRELITAMKSEPLPSQKKKLELFFNTWKGSQEQVDDVLLIGIKIR